MKKLLLGLVALVVLVAGVGYARFAWRRARTYDFPALALASNAVARGDHLAHTLGGCAECHGADFGGKLLGDDPVMRLVAPNLTPAGIVRDFSTQDWARAIVHGTDRTGRSLLVMPTKELSALADDDVAALIAYMQSLPAVERSLATSNVKLPGQVLFGLIDADVLSAEGYDHRRIARAPAAAATREYGLYMAQVCRGCHGADLHGGIEIHPGAPPSADISAGALASWSFADFERALREGKRRDGRMLDASMPWRALTAELDAHEMRALWLGLGQD